MWLLRYLVCAYNVSFFVRITKLAHITYVHKHNTYVYLRKSCATGSLACMPMYKHLRTQCVANIGTHARESVKQIIK